MTIRQKLHQLSSTMHSGRVKYAFFSTVTLLIHREVKWMNFLKNIQLLNLVDLECKSNSVDQPAASGEESNGHNNLVVSGPVELTQYPD